MIRPITLALLALTLGACGQTPSPSYDIPAYTPPVYRDAYRGTIANPVYVRHVPNYYRRANGNGPILFGMGFGGKSHRHHRRR